VNIARIMSEAGVSVGDFHKHFSSRDELIAEAISLALEDAASWNSLASVDLGDAINDYLSPAQYDDLAPCTVLSSFAAEIRRSSFEARDLLADHLRSMLAAIASGMPAQDTEHTDQRAMTILSALVGASLLARSIPDEELSRQLRRFVSVELRMRYALNPKR
jgi:TetR/AcrR family transcriptional repressor of nem operon